MARLFPEIRDRFMISISVTLLVLSLFFGCLGIWKVVRGQELDPQPMKEKAFYLHTLNETRNVGAVTTQHTMDSTIGDDGDAVTSNMRIVSRWLLFPELAGTLHLQGNLTLILWYKAQGTRDGAIWTLTVNEIDEKGKVNLIQLAERDLSSDPTMLTETSISTFVNHTLQPGSTLEAHINIKGNSATDYTIAWGNSTYNSRIILPAKDYIRIVPAGEGGIWTLNSRLQAQSNFEPHAENKTIYLRTKITDPFGGYDIQWVNITVETPDGTVIPELTNKSMSKILGYFNSFESVFQVSWNYSGYGEGRYNLTVYALDNNGYLSFVSTGNFEFHLEVDESGVFFIGAPPLEIYVRVFDGDEGPLEGALTLFLLGEEVQTSGITNSSGYVKVDLASGNYRVEVWWQGTLVGWKGLFADTGWSADEPFIITAAVYQLSFRVLDVRGAPLEGAAISLRFPNSSVTDEPFLADDQGTVSLGKSPGGDYDVVVVWRGKVVAEETFLVDASKTVNVPCLVYHVNFHAEDGEGMDVKNALITVLDPLFGTIVEAKLTNSSGWLSSRLPAGSYEVDAKWFGVHVLKDESLTIENNADVYLKLQIYKVVLVPVDSQGVELEDATVSVSSGVFSQSGNTFEAGSVEFKLPVGNYTTKVSWQNVEVFSKTLNVNGNRSTITLNTNVFYLTVQTFDNSQSPLEGVFVTIAKDGTTVGSARTDNTGRAEFRLATSTYDLSASFKTTYYLTYYHDIQTATINLNRNQTQEIVFVSFPIAFYTTILFYILALIVACVTCTAIIFFLKFRGVGK